MKKKILALYSWYERYERHFSSVALFAGFVVDSLTLRRVDLFAENAVIVAYLAVAATGIAVTNLIGARSLGGRVWGRVRMFGPLAIQFSFGALFSALIVFYFRSSSLGANWPFLFLLAGLLVGNEFFRSRYSMLVFQAIVFYIAFFSYLIFSVPIVAGRIGADIFLLSGAISLVAMWLMYLLLRVVMLAHARAHARSLVTGILATFAIINGLYFTNSIPPIPLGLKDAGVYHAVERISGTDRYRVETEDESWYRYLLPYEIIHLSEGEAAFVYTAVFAPTNLDTVIFHEWQMRDPETLKWTPTDRLRFPISGGRDGGYRGYSMKTTVSSGRWRVDIVTGRGQRLGRVNFLVERSEYPISRVEEER